MSSASLEAAAPHISSRFTLITDDISSDGNLLLHHFLALHLKSGRKVNLVGADQSLFHYSSVAKKAGLTLVGNSQFHYTNALVAPYLFSISASTLGALGAELKTFVESSGPCGACIIIDSLSHFLLLAETNVVIDWLQGLLSLTLIPNVFIVVALHRDAIDSTLLYRLIYEADTVLTCEGLETGQARDVHGQVTISTRGSPTNRAPPKTEKLHYRATDQTVSFFPPGSKLP